MKAQALLNAIKTEYENILGSDLTGIYVHGSLAFGCFSWEKSDIDFLVVVQNEPTLAQKIALMQTLLSLDEHAPEKGFEMSVVLEKDCRHFTYPTPYVLHYSNSYRESCRADVRRHCETLHGVDPDLAAHFTVTRAVGIVLCGKPIKDVFAPVPRQAYWASLRYDAADAREALEENPVYYILNLCRVLAYKQEDLILSKAQGGAWGLQNLPKHSAVIEAALANYEKGAPFTAKKEALHAFAQELLSIIEA